MPHTSDRPGLRSVLARPGYRRPWGARTVSQAGDVLQFTTLALLVYELTGSGLSTSAVVLAEIPPTLLGALGVTPSQRRGRHSPAADRWDRSPRASGSALAW